MKHREQEAGKGLMPTPETGTLERPEFYPDWDYNAQDRNASIEPRAKWRCVACNKPLAFVEYRVTLAADGLSLLPAQGNLSGREPIGQSCVKRIPIWYVAHISPLQVPEWDSAADGWGPEALHK
jgi:hypothetical protein